MSRNLSSYFYGSDRMQIKDTSAKRIMHAIPTVSAASHPTRLRMMLAVLLAIVGLGLLGYRIYYTLVVSPPIALLRLHGEDVTLDPPPPLSPDDRLAVQQ